MMLTFVRHSTMSIIYMMYSKMSQAIQVLHFKEIYFYAKL